MLGIQNNVSALNAQHNLGRSQNSLNTSIERLSSGFKVNRGADGPAALVISEKQRAQIASEDACCAICGNGDYEDDDQIVFCVQCSMPVH